MLAVTLSAKLSLRGVRIYRVPPGRLTCPRQAAYFYYVNRGKICAYVQFSRVLVLGRILGYRGAFCVAEPGGQHHDR